MDAENYYLITEYCSGGDLFDVKKDVPLSEKQVAWIIYQILLALNHIYKMKIMHRDLKLENILVTKKEQDGLFRIKIWDFGTSHLFEDGKKEKLMESSSFYITPEVFKNKINDILLREHKFYYMEKSKKGYDCRKEGLVWIIANLLELQVPLEYHHFPKYLKPEQIDYLKKYANLKLKQNELKIIINVLKKKRNT